MRLMIIDDDDQIRDGMAYGIQWDNLGIDQVECCRNGKEALDILMQGGYELVITDISMPVLSGIELMKLVKEKLPDIHFILISGYKEFEYAQAGVRYGADDYILKPIHLDELIDTVTNVIRKIERQQEDTKNRAVQERAEKERLMKQIIQGQITDERTIRNILKEGCGFPRIDALIGAAVRRSHQEFRWEYGGEDWELFNKKVTEHLAGYTYTGTILNEREMFWLIDVPDSTLRIFHLQQQIRKMLDDINRRCEQNSFSIGISEAGYPKDIPHLYACAEKALEGQWFTEKGRCLFYQDCFGGCQKEIQTEEWNQEILQYIKEGNQEKLKKCLDNIGEQLMQCRKASVQEFFFQNMMYVTRKFERVTLSQEIRRQMDTSESFAECMEIWTVFLQEVIQRYTVSKKYSREIWSALEYIAGHYMEKITTEDLAEHLEISSGHFSRLFKKQVGVSFVKYLNQYRMDQAEELLRNTNLKVYEVAERVGIPDYIYFTQVFRSIKGMVPTDIRK